MDDHRLARDEGGYSCGDQPHNQIGTINQQFARATKGIIGRWSGGAIVDGNIVAVENGKLPYRRKKGKRK